MMFDTFHVITWLQRSVENIMPRYRFLGLGLDLKEDIIIDRN